MKAKMILIVLLATLFLVACNETPETGGDETASNIIMTVDRKNVVRFVDDEAGVVCWMFDRTDGYGGLSCRPLAETELEE